MIKEGNKLIDYDHMYSGTVHPLDGLPAHEVKAGYKVFNEGGVYDGLLDVDGVAIWAVEEADLVQLV